VRVILSASGRLSFSVAGFGVFSMPQKMAACSIILCIYLDSSLIQPQAPSVKTLTFVYCHQNRVAMLFKGNLYGGAVRSLGPSGGRPNFI
jgi:hypothetical protein